MSGGGVFATTSCKPMGTIIVNTPVPMLVAVHGRAEQSEAKGITGFNFAIPVAALSQYSKLGEYLNPQFQRAGFGCVNGYSKKIEVFAD